MIRWAVIVGMLGIGISPLSAQSPKDLRIPVAGHEQLFRKVLVTGDNVTLHLNTPDNPGSPVKPFAIFTKLRLKDQPPTGTGKEIGELKQGSRLFVRVGDSNGSELGFIDVTPETEGDLKDVPKYVDWNTRFAMGTPKRNGAVLYNDQKLSDGMVEWDGKAGGANQQILIPLLDEIPDGEAPMFRAAIFTGGATSKGDAPTQMENRQVADLKLDIIFVIDTTASMELLLEDTKKVVSNCVEAMDQFPELKKQVRFGMVVYQDSTPGLNVSEVVSKLTDNLAEFKKVIGPVKVATIGSEETEEDVIAGLNKALDDGGWAENSSKHIILLGDASAHLTGPKNTTGLDYKKILAKAQSNAGAETNKLLSSKTFHAIHIQNPDDAVNSIIAQEEFSTLAKNNGFQGVYDSINPGNEDDRARVVKSLVDLLTGGIKTLQAARKGNVKAAERIAENNPIAQGPFKILKSTLGNRVPVQVGFTAERDNQGKQIADVLIMVRPDEVRKMQSTLNFLHDQLSDLTPEQRQDAKVILNKVKELVALSLAGQNQTVDANTPIDELIKDLPIRPEVLRISVQLLAQKKDKEYDAWLKGLKETADVAGVIYNESKKAQSANVLEVDYGKGKKELYMFLKRNDIP